MAMSEISKETRVIETVGEMIDALSEFNRDMPIKGTWEGTVEEIRVYPGAACKLVEGKVIWTRTIMVDCDEGDYRKRNQVHINESNDSRK